MAIAAPTRITAATTMLVRTGRVTTARGFHAYRAKARFPTKSLGGDVERERSELVDAHHDVIAGQ